MKHLLGLLVFAVSLETVAQRPFEGIITYQVDQHYMKDRESESRLLLRMTLAPNRILMETNEIDRDIFSGRIIILLDSGKAYHLDTEEKSYFMTYLRKFITSQATPKSILGYPALPQEIRNWGPDIHIGTAWFSDSLVYPVPDFYSQNMELMMIKDGKILMEGKFSVQDPGNRSYENNELEMDDQTIEFKAVSIERKKISPTLFQIPRDYSLKQDHFINPELMSDSVAILVDTAHNKVIEEYKSVPEKKQSEKLPSKPAKLKKAELKKEE